MEWRKLTTHKDLWFGHLGTGNGFNHMLSFWEIVRRYALGLKWQYNDKQWDNGDMIWRWPRSVRLIFKKGLWSIINIDNWAETWTCNWGEFLHRLALYLLPYLSSHSQTRPDMALNCCYLSLIGRRTQGLSTLIGTHVYNYPQMIGGNTSTFSWLHINC